MLHSKLLVVDLVSVVTLVAILLQDALDPTVVPSGWPAVAIAFFGVVTLIVNSYVVIASMKHAQSMADIKSKLEVVTDKVSVVDEKVGIVDEKATETVVMGNHNTTVMREQAVDTAKQLLMLLPGDQSAIDRLKRAEQALALQILNQAEAIAAAKRVGARNIDDRKKQVT